MAIAKKIEGFMSQSSWIRKMFEEGDNLKKLYGDDQVFDFSLGNPNIAPPEQFSTLLNKICLLNISFKHGYMHNAGYKETREAVASHLSSKHGVPLTYNNIIMTCGAGGALNVILKTLLDPGDEVLIPTPFFVEYRFYIDNVGGVTKLVKTAEDFSLDLTAMSDAFTEKTKIVLINSPNNPTGKVYDQRSINSLAGIIAEKCQRYGNDIYLLSDEPYRDIAYDGVHVPSILAACKNGIVASSYSKSLSIPGERIGYLAINPSIDSVDTVIDGAILCNRILGFVNAPALMQRIIPGLQGASVAVEEYKKKRDILCEGLSSIGYEFVKPEGAFYLFVKSPIADDAAFVNELLHERIITVPGSGFGGPGYFRIAYCVDDKTITNAMQGFAIAMKRVSGSTL